MRILVVGAGAIGGYFGGRLLQVGRDVTFLVRPRRAAELARIGLAIRSGFGDINLPSPPTISEDALKEPFNLVLLSSKAYDLAGAMASFAPALGADTAILPLLNGMRHLHTVGERFGRTHVLGGQCVISATLDPDGRVLHLNDMHSITFGEQDGSQSARAEAIAAELSGAGPAGDVGEMGVHRSRCGNHLSDASRDRRHRYGRRCRPHHRSLRRMRPDRRCQRLRPAVGICRADAPNVRRARLPSHRLDAPGCRARRSDRRRPHPRRPPPSCECKGRYALPPARRLCHVRAYEVRARDESDL